MVNEEDPGFISRDDILEKVLITEKNKEGLSDSQSRRIVRVTDCRCAFIDQAFDSVETETVIDALLTQGVPTQYIRVLRELYSGFATKISPFYIDFVIDVKRGVRQGDTISPKLFGATPDLGTLQPNLSKKMFMRNGRVSDAPFSLSGTNISGCFNYVYLGSEANMIKNLAPGGKARLGQLRLH
ncbi:unnamed protein product [Heligmosomoides polygyrus]|uniref:Reverse transcriptase domain-containing protein n=1 Tax=Heligmosomoides polygyrus TaxID=6339 RepID=A0A183GGP5_HELPZ|nr:unnamed protein product [Heligmosomoides polygyrus]